MAQAGPPPFPFRLSPFTFLLFWCPDPPAKIIPNLNLIFRIPTSDLRPLASDFLLSPLPAPRQTRISNGMLPDRNRLRVVVTAILIACAAFSALPAKALPAADGVSPNALVNLSTRSHVDSGDNVVIAGFIVTGTQPKQVIIRAIGPSLPFPGHLDNPTLELRDSSGALLESNDDWATSKKKQAIMDSTIPPTNELESAIVMTLNPGTYTAIAQGLNGGTGIGVVEVYDLEPAADSKLANISTRGFVSTGDNVMVAGTIIVGATPQKVIIRAIGPSLSLPGKLADPTLELRDANGGLMDANDNWGDSPNKQAIIDSTIRRAIRANQRS
jgi:hypothetical protein